MLRKTLLIIPGLMILIGIGFSAESVLAQRERRSRSGELLKERLEDRLQADTADAIKLLNQDFAAFAEKYLDPDTFDFSEEKLSSSEIERMRKVLKQFAAAPVILLEGNEEAVIAVELTEEDAKALEPPAPVKKKLKLEVTGYGDDIVEVIKLGLADLQAKNYQDFIHKLYPLAELEQLKEQEQESWAVEQLSMDYIQLKQLERDFEQILQLKPTITEFQGMKLAVYQILTEKIIPDENRNRMDTSRLKSPGDRIVAFEQVGKNWRFVDGNKQAREAMLQARTGMSGEGLIQLRWEMKESGWRIVEIPFF